MKAAIGPPGASGIHFVVKDVPIPELEPFQILVRLSATGVCGIDFALASGEAGPSRDILGHEGVGRVVKLGAGVSTCQVSLGDRVGIAWVHDICQTCEYCLSPGGETRCAEQLNSGRKWDGTFAEYAVIPSRYIIRILDSIELPDAVIAPVLCGDVTAYKALKISDATPGQWIAISGAGGGVGSLVIQYACAMGYRVIAIDAGHSKGDVCRKLGAEIYIDVLQTGDLSAIVNEKTKGCNASAVLVAAGNGTAYEAALSILTPFGTLICIGIPPPNQFVSFHPLTFIDKGIRIIESAVGTRGDILEAIAFVERGLVKPLIQKTKLENLSDIAKEFGKTSGKYVIEFFEAGDDPESS